MSIPDSPTSATPSRIHTYHCPCTQLLLATPHSISTLPRRQHPSTPKYASIILPLGSLHAKKDDSNPTLSSSTSSFTSILPSVLLSTTIASKPTLIRREDGFEKVRLRRCGRCRTVVGYGVEGEEGGREKREGAGGEVLYLFEGGLVESGELESGELGSGEQGVGE